MSSPYKSLDDGIAVLTPATDLTNYEGYGVTISGNTATVSASATTQIRGVVIAGGSTTQTVSVAILGATAGAIKVKISGAVTRGDLLVQHTDGSFITDPGSGGRVVVGVANQTGVSGDLIDMFPRTPISLS